MSAEPQQAAQMQELQHLEQQCEKLVSAGQIDEAAPLFQQRMKLLRELVDAALLLAEDARIEPLARLQQHFIQLEKDIKPVAASLQQVRDELVQLGKNNKAANAYGITNTLRK